MKQIVVALMFMGLWITSQVQAAGHASPANLLILPFDNSTQESSYAALKMGIPDLLSALLSIHPEQIWLVERDRLDAIVQEKSLSWQQYVEGHSLKKIGELSLAEYIIRGSLTMAGADLNIQILVYRTETTQLVKSIEVKGNPNQLTDLCRQLAAELVNFFSTATASATPLPVDEDPEKSSLMISGLGYFYSAQFHRAFPAFMKIIKKDPNDPMARYWLGRCFLEAGLMDHATMELQKFLQSFPDHEKVREVRQLLTVAARRVQQ